MRNTAIIMEMVHNVIGQCLCKKSQKRRKHLMIGGIILVLLFIVAAVWRLTLLKHLNIKVLLSIVRDIRFHPLAPLLVLGAYLAGSLAVAPSTVLIILTNLIFGTTTGFFYSLGGIMVSAIATYGIGLLLGQDRIHRLAGQRVNEVSRHLARQGILTIVVVRLFPIAPFTVVNIIAGVSHIRFRDFIIGTFLGMTLNILAITLLVDRVGKAVRMPGLHSFGIATGVIGSIALAVLALRWWLRKHDGSSDVS